MWIFNRLKMGIECWEFSFFLFLFSCFFLFLLINHSVSFQFFCLFRSFMPCMAWVFSLDAICSSLTSNTFGFELHLILSLLLNQIERRSFLKRSSWFMMKWSDDIWDVGPVGQRIISLSIRVSEDECCHCRIAWDVLSLRHSNDWFVMDETSTLILFFSRLFFLCLRLGWKGCTCDTITWCCVKIDTIQ